MRAVDETFLRAFADRWDAAWNSHDTGRVLELLHEDIEWDDTVFWTEVIHGKTGMRAYVDEVFRVMPDVVFEGVQLFTAPEDGRGCWLFRQSGRAPEGLGDDGRFSTFGMDVWLGFRDGLLSRYLAQYEITEMMRQYGALPPREGRRGGAYLLSILGGRS